jgi:hypothetical protein
MSLSKACQPAVLQTEIIEEILSQAESTPQPLDEFSASSLEAFDRQFEEPDGLKAMDVMIKDAAEACLKCKLLQIPVRGPDHQLAIH